MTIDLAAAAPARAAAPTTRTAAYVTVPCGICRGRGAVEGGCPRCAGDGTRDVPLGYQAGEHFFFDAGGDFDAKNIVASLWEIRDAVKATGALDRESDKVRRVYDLLIGLATGTADPNVTIPGRQIVATREYVARRLGIHPEAARRAVNRLVALKLISKTDPRDIRLVALREWWWRKPLPRPNIYTVHLALPKPSPYDALLG